MLHRTVTTTTQSSFRDYGPRIRIQLAGDTGAWEGLALIDTGSEFSAVSAAVAHEIGAVDLGKPIRLTGAGGQQSGL